jgi:hypothetical protein
MLFLTQSFQAFHISALGVPEKIVDAVKYEILVERNIAMIQCPW